MVKTDIYCYGSAMTGSRPWCSRGTGRAQVSAPFRTRDDLQASGDHIRKDSSAEFTASALT